MYTSEFISLYLYHVKVCGLNNGGRGCFHLLMQSVGIIISILTYPSCLLSKVAHWQPTMC